MQSNSCKDISLLTIRDLHVGLMHERKKNHDGFQFIHNGHDGKIKDQCDEAKRDYKVPKVRKSSQYYLQKCNKPPRLHSKSHTIPILKQNYKGDASTTRWEILFNCCLKDQLFKMEEAILGRHISFQTASGR